MNEGKKYPNKILALAFIIVFSCSLHAQNEFPFVLKKKTDVTLNSIGIVLSGLGFYSTYTIEPYSKSTILLLDKNSIRPKFDQSATKYWSNSIKNASDVGLGISTLGVTAFSASQLKRKNEWWTVSVMGAEAFLWTYGFTAVAKGIRQRGRPFLYNSNILIEEKLSKDARQSFFSGHTSMSAASCVFAAEIFIALHPDSRWKPWIRTASFVLPGTVGFLRYRSGKHFPTDVLTGWAVGSLIGWAVPHLHLKKTEEILKHIEVIPSPFGLSILVR